MDSPGPAVFQIGALVSVVIGLIPILIAMAQARKGLRLCAFVLGLASLPGLVLGVTGVAGAAAIGGALWLGGLVCGVAAFLDAAAERRMQEQTFRLLHGDARNLPLPKTLKGLPPPHRQDGGSGHV